MPKKYGITYRFLANVVEKNEQAVKTFFSRNGWSITEVRDVKEYLKRFIKSI